MSRAGPKGAGGQSGVALLISLALLLVLTVAGVSAVQMTTLEARMARNAHDRMLALQAAESALRDAEHAVETMKDLAGVPATAGLGEAERWRDGWICDHEAAVPAATPLAGLAEGHRPCHLIEHLATVIRGAQGDDASVQDRIEILRITAGAAGATAETRVLLQSTYGRRFEAVDGDSEVSASGSEGDGVGRLSWRELAP